MDYLKDYRVGNYLKRTAPFNDICRLATITNNPYVIHANGGTYHYFDQLEPIPITGEWLELLGFSLVIDTGYWSIYSTSNGMRISRWTRPSDGYHDEGSWYYGEIGQFPPVKYVHQWQNIVHAIWGIELSYTKI